MLRDMGISRSEINRVVRRPREWGDPEGMCSF